MSDPRNAAHAKKVKQEKAHAHTDQPASAKKSARKKKDAPVEEAAPIETAPPPPPVPVDLEKSVAVLSKLKDLEFHSRANVETLAQLTLTIEEELKQKEFSEGINGLFAAQNDFQTKIAALIEDYSGKTEAMKT